VFRWESQCPEADGRERQLGVRKRPFAWNAGKRLRAAMSRHRRFRMDGPVTVSTYCPSRAPEPALAVCIVRCVSHMGLRLSLSKSRVSSRTRANRVFLRRAAADKHGVGLRVNSAGARGSHRVGCSPWIPTRAETAAWATSVSAAPFRVLPDLRLNLSKSGVSTSIGRRGAWFTVGPKGTRTTVGLSHSGSFLCRS
jgi:hypothetical protein